MKLHSRGIGTKHIEAKTRYTRITFERSKETKSPLKKPNRKTHNPRLVEVYDGDYNYMNTEQVALNY